MSRRIARPRPSDHSVNEAAGDFVELIRAAVAPWGLEVTSEQGRLLHHHYVAMCEVNRSVNLTRVTDARAATARHYADSMAPLWYFREKEALGGSGPTIRDVLDVGTGAGFPAFPLAVLRPLWRVTAIDSTAKKIDFLREVITRFGPPNLKGIHARLEHWKSEVAFDLITSRATGATARLVARASRLLTTDGRLMIFMSESQVEKERALAEQVATRKGLALETPFRYDVPTAEAPLRRALMVFVRPNREPVPP